MIKKSNKKVSLITILVVALMFILTTNVSAATTFKDVSKGNSHYEGITYLTSEGIINGYEDGNYRPGQTITRSQTAVLFTRALKLPVPQNVSATLENFKDIDASHMYAKQIASTYQAGIFRGSQGNFNDGELTREQMATVLVNAFDLEEVTESKVDINLSNVSPSHQANVQALAHYGITNQLDNFRPSEAVTRGQFATFMKRTMDIKAESIEKPNVEPTVSEFEEINNKEGFVGDNMQDIELPKEIKVYYSDDSFVSRGVIWDTSNVEFNNPGNYNIMGSVEGIEETIEIKISVIKLEVESIEKIDYNSIKIGENYYGYGKEAWLGLQYGFLELHEATLNNKDKILFIPNKESVRYSDYWGYSSYGAISKLVLVATDNYSIVPSENPYFDGSIKQLPENLKDIKEEYPNSKLEYRSEKVYDSISNTYQEDFYSYNGNEYKVPVKYAEEIREGNIFGNYYFEAQGIRHISGFINSPYIAVNDLFNYFGINKTITYGNDGDNVYLEFK